MPPSRAICRSWRLETARIDIHSSFFLALCFTLCEHLWLPDHMLSGPTRFPHVIVCMDLHFFCESFFIEKPVSWHSCHNFPHPDFLICQGIPDSLPGPTHTWEFYSVALHTELVSISPIYFPVCVHSSGCCDFRAEDVWIWTDPQNGQALGYYCCCVCFPQVKFRIEIPADPLWPVSSFLILGSWHHRKWFPHFQNYRNFNRQGDQVFTGCLNFQKHSQLLNCTLCPEKFTLCSQNSSLSGSVFVSSSGRTI